MKISYDEKDAEMKGMGRRDALKQLGLGSAALLAGGSTSASAKTKLSAFASRKEADIVIAGGGTAGITVAARLRRSAPNASITLIAPNDVHLYQSGQVYVAAGLYREFDNKRRTKELIPDNVTWLHDKVMRFSPEENTVYTEKNGKIPYDYLVVALGCEYDYGWVEGVSVSDIGKKGIASVYLNDVDEGLASGATISRMWLRAVRRHAQRSEQKVLFADPKGPVKGEGASLDMLFLANDMLKGNGRHKKGEDLRSKVSLTLSKAGEHLFPSPEIERAVKRELALAKNVTVSYGEELAYIDKERKVAVYNTSDGQRIERAYDFLHITPEVKPPEVLGSSGLAVENGPYEGWLEVDEKTLRNPRYPNVFGLGDIVGLPSGKSGGAVREQAIVLQDNIAAVLEDKKLPMEYNGYSVHPIRTRYGRVILAEYTPHGPEPTFPLDPAKPRWLWWEMDLHLMRTAYFGLMMRGML
ncbi:MAG: pyridine nucleotide-disulfide oxidoreductase [Epsilonproteobacteria bacterium 4484_20]|nr:MAG: pyridine nucleotide-disulfide oxidoreductase [Epsilonproteobacteria bacterium 4484_20]